MVSTDIDLSDWLRLIKAEYLEMPGLSLTQPQVQRLWGLNDVTCESIINTMISDHFLRRTEGGAYIRADIRPQKVP